MKKKIRKIAHFLEQTIKIQAKKILMSHDD